MTSQSEQDTLNRNVNTLLDEANAKLSDEVLSDITQARLNALHTASAKRDQKNKLPMPIQWWQRMQQEVMTHQFRYVAPAAVAVIVAVLVSYNQSNTVPVLPEVFFTGDIPGEELALLEDLEFASWLAEQQQEGRL
ncbi:DUF3619 family protein [Planctobacterium marinum]|uniref:DUF3619 family protein n=1 Tax=Planctobacterium marinum TaxID=1631968 RepID=A0AA48HI11_9ALTE|nr:hypothetical protein MACH26_12000 [Planctobacterium marinum]